MIAVRNRVCQIEVACEWHDPVTHLDYDFSAKVIVSRSYEIETVDFLSIDVYGGDEPLDHDVAWVLAMQKPVKENLETIAGAKALEKVQYEDFAREGDRE